MLTETISLLIREFFDQKITSIGMITAQNKQKQNEEDDSIIDQILKDLQSVGFEPLPTHYYGDEGYLVPNIPKNALIALGKKYNQNFVVWAERVPEDRNGMTFKWEFIENGKIRNEKISNHPFVCPNFNE